MSESTSTGTSGAGTDAEAPGAPTVGIARLDTVVLDTPDPARDAGFWAALTGGEITGTDDDWYELRTPDGWQLAFQLAPDLVPPQWPGQEHPQQLHLDLSVPDLTKATEEAIAAGARVLRENETWNTLADPAGHTFDLVASAEVAMTAVWGVSFDVDDASVAARFWARVLGDPVEYDGAEGAMLGGGKALMFQRVEGYQAPDWPDPARPQQGHLDLVVPDGDLDAAEEAVIALGARRLPGEGEGFRVFADPAGHPFCLCR